MAGFAFDAPAGAFDFGQMLLLPEPAVVCTGADAHHSRASSGQEFSSDDLELFSQDSFFNHLDGTSVADWDAAVAEATDAWNSSDSDVQQLQRSAGGLASSPEFDSIYSGSGHESGNASLDASPAPALLHHDTHSLVPEITAAPGAFPSSVRPPLLPTVVNAVGAEVEREKEVPARPTGAIAYDMIDSLPKYKRKAKRLTKNSAPAPKVVGAAARAKAGVRFRELSEEEALRLSGEQIDQYFADLRSHRKVSATEERDIKRLRRLVKNREYAQMSRDKKRAEQTAARRAAKSVEQQAEQVRANAERLEEENRILRDHLSRIGAALQRVPQAVELLARETEAPPAEVASLRRSVAAAAAVNAAKGTALALFVVLFSFALVLPAMDGSVPAGTVISGPGGLSPSTGRVLLHDGAPPASLVELTLWEAYAPPKIQQLAEDFKFTVRSWVVDPLLWDGFGQQDDTDASSFDTDCLDAGEIPRFSLRTPLHRPKHEFIEQASVDAPERTA